MNIINTFKNSQEVTKEEFELILSQENYGRNNYWNGSYYHLLRHPKYPTFGIEIDGKYYINTNLIKELWRK
jgi:hypothetical protein